MKFRSTVDTSNLTPEELANAELMAEFTNSKECRKAFNTCNLAENLLPALLESDHRPAPVDAFNIALKYAEHANTQGEAFMHDVFETWKAARPTEPAPPLDEVDDLDADVIPLADTLPRVAEETITRDDAIADTERRAQVSSSLPGFDDDAALQAAGDNHEPG